MTIPETLKNLDELEDKAAMCSGTIAMYRASDDAITFLKELAIAYPSLRAEIERLQGEVERLKLDVSAKSIQKKDPGI